KTKNCFSTLFSFEIILPLKRNCNIQICQKVYLLAHLRGYFLLLMDFKDAKSRLQKKFLSHSNGKAPTGLLKIKYQKNRFRTKLITVTAVNR
ncbi:MAG: hypothetical protein LUF78_04265, partial [Clostridiales bacterium]|nr:hypothetical protein [Clostridiales bacterium]